MNNEIIIKRLKDFAIENSSLSSNLTIKLINLQNLVISINQFLRLISFVKSQNREIYLYISDPYILHFYIEIRQLLTKEFQTELKHLRIGTKKELFAYLKTNHNIGLIFSLNISDSSSDSVLEKYAFHRNIFLFSAVLPKAYVSQINSLLTKFQTRYFFPLSVNNIKDNILFILLLLLI